MDDKKAFFARKTPAQIKEGKEPVILEQRKVVSALQNLSPDRYAIIPENIFDADFDPQKFFKHGETIWLPNRSPFWKTPVALLREAIEHPQTRLVPYLSGFSFKPLSRVDKKIRRVPLVELLEAARILAYGKEYPGADVTVDHEYATSLRVSQEGGSFIVSTPSRTKKHPRYRFKISSIPVDARDNFVHTIPYGFVSRELGVESKAFRELRFTFRGSYESSQFNYIQAHEIAAAYAIAETELKKDNDASARFLLFPIVSQQAVDLYQKLLNRTILQVTEKDKSQEKHLTQAHMEAILWSFVRRQGYEAGFDDTALLEGRVRNYNWNNHV